MIDEVTRCRICGSTDLIKVISLGNQALTGVFPKVSENDPAIGPLELIRCAECTLVQLRHSFSPEAMYGDNYGYRSGLNASMVQHLESKISKLASKFGISSKSVVLDIGSNDGTSCNKWLAYTNQVVGMDPTANKFASYYDKRVKFVSDFFSSKRFLDLSDKADMITSIAMFYDLDDPVHFAQEIYQSLSENGVWHLEQSYLPSMLAANAYDTICHEHVEYYSLTSLNEIFIRANLKIVEVALNDVNGGSIAVTVAKNTNTKYQTPEYLSWLLKEEHYDLYENPSTKLSELQKRVEHHKESLIDLLVRLRKEGEIWGLGASTKGNVLLQYCEIDENLITAIADVNPDKMNRVTPGTRIPIKSEGEWERALPRYSLVLPWHFKRTFLSRSDNYSLDGGQLIFPLPRIEVLG
jgi:SAM-dependent methyltransferase